jgi:hypothetical protein
MRVWIDGKRYAIRPSDLIGAGGEAEVYAIDTDRVVKIFKGPDHPHFKGDRSAQQAAEKRLAVHQEKLEDFPSRMPKAVVTPSALATRRKAGGEIVGYTMRRVEDPEPFHRFADPGFRRQGGDSNRVVRLLTRVHATLASLHGLGVVIGDLNDANLLATEEDPWFIDADSWQYGPYTAQMFTTRFVDPRLCDPGASAPFLVKQYDREADWYAYTVLLMRSLLCVGPYGGIFRPADPSERIPHAQRPLKRVTVWHPEVKYPKPATPYEVLPDELLGELQAVFQEDRRGVFPAHLVERLEFRRCSSCKKEHARPRCPDCHAQTPATRRHLTTRGEVAAETVFQTCGVILEAAYQDSKLLVLHHEDGMYRRENGRELFSGALDPGLRFHLRGQETILVRGREAVVLDARSQPVARHSVQATAGAAALATNGRHRYWLTGGELRRDDHLVGERRMGAVLAGHSRIWAGPTFGLGLSRAGGMTIVFRFDADHPGIADDLEAPRLTGELLDATCTLDESRAWLLLAERRSGRIIHHVRVYHRTGALEAAGEYPADEALWAGHLTGKLAAGGMLFSATDWGLERVEVDGSALTATRSFPDTEPFLDATSRLLTAPTGLAVVGESTVATLRLGPPPNPRGTP